MNTPIALPSRAPNKWRPLDIPFDHSILRTGDCLVRIGLGTELNGNQLIAHILPEKYPALKAACPGLQPRSRKFKIPPDQQIHDRPTKLNECTSDRDWTFPIVSEKFNPDEWQVIPLPGMPKHLQPPPEPFAGADDYKTFSIPNIRKRTAAKTDRGRERFRQRMQQIWSDRKRLYTCGIKLLRDVNFCKQTRSIDGPADNRDSCPRCGCSLFVPKGKKNRPARFSPGTIYETLSCYDCGYVPRSRPRYTQSAETSEGEELRSDNGRQQPAPRLTQREFVIALSISGQLQKLSESEELRKATGSYLQLCEGWLPENIRNMPGFEGETEAALRQRAARLLRKLKDHQEAGKPLPVLDEEIPRLREKIFVMKDVT